MTARTRLDALRPGDRIRLNGRPVVVASVEPTENPHQLVLHTTDHNAFLVQRGQRFVVDESPET